MPSIQPLKPLKIAMVAPLSEATPPRLYGGTERVVANLTNALVGLGHQVTLFASGDSVTNARLVAGRGDGSVRQPGATGRNRNAWGMFGRNPADLRAF